MRLRKCWERMTGTRYRRYVVRKMEQHIRALQRIRSRGMTIADELASYPQLPDVVEARAVWDATLRRTASAERNCRELIGQFGWKYARYVQEATIRASCAGS